MRRLVDTLEALDSVEVRLAAHTDVAGNRWPGISGWWRGEIELADQQVRNLS